MKNLFYLLLLGLFFTACQDDLQIVNGALDERVGVVNFSDTVFDVDNNELSGAVVSVYANNVRYHDITDENGKYNIQVPVHYLPVSGEISMSIVSDDYKPFNVTYLAPLFEGTTYDAQVPSLLLESCPDCLEVDGDKSSELFHLGDDRYSGTINSQFQKGTDGTEMVFTLKNNLIYSQIAISFEAKGVQPDSFDPGASVVFGTEGSSGGEGSQEQFIEQAPQDGSFGTYKMVFNNAEDLETITFITRNHGTEGSDYDDWEFTCVHVEGIR